MTNACNHNFSSLFTPNYDIRSGLDTFTYTLIPLYAFVCYLMRAVISPYPNAHLSVRVLHDTFRECESYELC